jgi:hypothetical protein
MPKPKPSAQDFEAVVRKVFLEHADKDMIDDRFLFTEAYYKIEVGFSRRAIRKANIYPEVAQAIERLVARLTILLPLLRSTPHFEKDPASGIRNTRRS